MLLGISADDCLDDIEKLLLRVFSDEQGKMNKSLIDVDGQILLISQFTLFASTKKGNRPSYIRSAHPDIAIPLYEAFHKCLEKLLHKQIPTGEFGADMKVSFVMTDL